MTSSDFSKHLLEWYDKFGRHSLPWQLEQSPYHVWISETMLQQTQVSTVTPYFKRFIHRFPSVCALAQADEDELMRYWSGLGYYRRAMYLHQSAKIIQDKHNGLVPDTYDNLIQLPGIGRSTAGAILSLGYNKAFPILDGNVKRVLCRYYGIKGWPDATKNLKQLWSLAETLLPQNRSRDYGQASMDLGALVCHKKKPKCTQCPLQAQCQTFRYQEFDTIPGKKPKTKIKKKTFYALLQQNSEHQWLLTKQPKEGLWPNLWTFPLIETKPESSSYVLQPFKHQLTHYQLTIIPILAFERAIEIPHEHFSLQAMKQLGLNRPSQKIAETLMLQPAQIPLMIS